MKRLTSNIIPFSKGWRKKRLVAAYKEIFATDAGKLVLEDMARAHHVWSTTHIRGDEYSSKVLEGERNVLLRIFKIINIGEHELSDMMERAEKGE